MPIFVFKTYFTYMNLLFSYKVKSIIILINID